MLAIKLEMINQLPSLEETRESAKYSDSPNISSTARLLDEWETKQGSSIGIELNRRQWRLKIARSTNIYDIFRGLDDKVGGDWQRRCGIYVVVRML